MSGIDQLHTPKRTPVPSRGLPSKAQTEGAHGVVPPIAESVLRSPGVPLDVRTRCFMESRFQRDLSHVRVHSDDVAAESAAQVHAKAYTVGSHIAFGVGHYAPNSSKGRSLLAHELTHVLQQPSQPPCGRISRVGSSRGLESEADSNESRIFGANRLTVPQEPSDLAC